MWTPPEPPLTTLTMEDPELIRLVLEKMSYLEIVEWCNASSHFRRLCEDPDSLIGDYINSRRQEKQIGYFSTDHNVSNNVFGLDELNVDSKDPFLSLYIDALHIHVEDAEEIVQAIIKNQTTGYDEYLDDWKWEFFSEETESGRITMGIYIAEGGPAIWTRFYPSDEEAGRGWSHITTVDENIIKSVFGAALMAYRRNVEVSDYVIFSDYTVHSVFGGLW